MTRVTLIVRRAALTAGRPLLAGAGVFLLVLALAVPEIARATEPALPLETFRELEASGATIGEIRISNREIFDTGDPKEDNSFFRTANSLHIQTRDSVISRALLFKSGDRLQVRVLEETERILRSSRYLYDVSIRPVAVRDGVVDIEVVTHDTWTLDPGFSFGRSGGVNTTKVDIREYNLLGTGTAVVLAHTSDVDRHGDEFEFFNERAFGTRTTVGYHRARYDDGSAEGAAVVRPFYSLDSRWAAGGSWLRDDLINAIYNAGEVASEYRHKRDRAELFGGWSPGQLEGWTRRYSMGARRQEDAYALEPGRTPPAALPPDEKLVYPFVRFEVIEERFQRLENRNQMGRPEFFALGLSSAVELGHATTGLGSTRDTWLYSGSLSRGFELEHDQTLMASAAISGRYADGRVERQQFGASARYYLPHHRRWLFYASAAGDVLTNPGPTDYLLLGGDSGLRGYPLRYQSGDRRALFTLEERVYTDYFLWRLFRFGGAVYTDIGRAWGGSNENKINSGWLADVGFGLRIFSVRSAFANALHLDVAFPLNPDANIKSVQFIVKTRASF